MHLILDGFISYAAALIAVNINPRCKDYMIASHYSAEPGAKKALELLERVGMKNRYNHYPKELSGGEKQRVAVARAIANNPDIILADEPTGNLDEHNEQEIFELLKNISNSGKCVIVVSHSNEVKKYADRVLKINEGRVEDIK